jgi:hypothetical protein
MESIFHSRNLRVPTAGSANTSRPGPPEAADAGAQCFSALGLLGMMAVVLPLQVICEVVPVTLEEMARELAKQLDEALQP